MLVQLGEALSANLAPHCKYTCSHPIRRVPSCSNARSWAVSTVSSSSSAGSPQTVPLNTLLSEMDDESSESEESEALSWPVIELQISSSTPSRRSSSVSESASTSSTALRNARNCISCRGLILDFWCTFWLSDLACCCSARIHLDKASARTEVTWKVGTTHVTSLARPRDQRVPMSDTVRLHAYTHLAAARMEKDDATIGNRRTHISPFLCRESPICRHSPLCDGEHPIQIGCPAWVPDRPATTLGEQACSVLSIWQPELFQNLRSLHVTLSTVGR